MKMIPIREEIYENSTGVGLMLSMGRTLYMTASVQSWIQIFSHCFIHFRKNWNTLNMSSVSQQWQMLR